MHNLLLALAINTTFTTPARTQQSTTGIARKAARGSQTARLSVDALCAQLTLDEVTAIMKITEAGTVRVGFEELRP